VIAPIHVCAEQKWKKCAKREAQSLFRGGEMLRWALGFFIVALVAAVLGFAGIAAAAAGIAKILFFVFLILFLASLLAHMGRRTGRDF
jgi:uncharacterized membrane protein YtjA (UPF0391 family)